MFLTIILVVFSLVGLVALHELGHFVFAKKFGVKVEEFGICLPPRIWGKQIGETIYSINWIPAGAFVRLLGEDENGSKDDPRSFAAKPIWQRMIIIAAGVVSFWLISVLIFFYTSLTGSIEAIDDDDPAAGAQVQIAAVSKDSPAMSAGLKMGDIVKSIEIDGAAVEIDKSSQIQEIAGANGGRQLVLEVIRGQKNLEMTITPRQNPPAGQGAMGVALVRVAPMKYSFWQAAGNGFSATWNMTLGVFDGWGQIFGRLFKNQGLPEGAQMVGPVGIMQMMAQRAQMGINYYLQFTAMISVYLAVFNALPIPALDGGRLMFLALEAIFRKPVPQKIEQRLTMFFFMALMLFAIIVTVQDVIRLF